MDEKLFVTLEFDKEMKDFFAKEVERFGDAPVELHLEIMLVQYIENSQVEDVALQNYAKAIRKKIFYYYDFVDDKLFLKPEFKA